MHPAPSASFVQAESSGSYIDMHSHNFVYTQDDAMEFIADPVGADPATNKTAERVDRTLTMRDAGVAQSVFFGSYDGETEGSWRRAPGINAVGAAALARSAEAATFFLPFYGIPEWKFDTLSPEDLADLEMRLRDDGFAGIGELLVHGHTKSYAPMSSTFMAIFELAVKYEVPVSVHWEFGNTFDGSDDFNWNQLIDLLDRFPETNERAGLKLILCHCGLGPPDPTSRYDIDADVPKFTTWKARIRTLLEWYPGVYFDVAGMQLGTAASFERVWRLYDADSDTLTNVGDFLRWMMSSSGEGYTDRFVFGSDCDNRYDVDPRAGVWGVASHIDSVPMYMDFCLIPPLLSTILPDQLMSAGAEAALYG